MFYLGPGVGVFPFFKSSIIDSTSLLVKSSYEYDNIIDITIKIVFFFLENLKNKRHKMYPRMERSKMKTLKKVKTNLIIFYLHNSRR